VFGQWLCDMAAHDPRLVGITPAMREGSGMVAFHQQFPERYHDVGIAEQHAVTFAAGLACEGLKPVVAIYSTFLQRAYDQLIHDVALQNLPVVFALDRAGLVGADGATHAGAYDIAFLQCIPNMALACPANERECRQLLSTAYAQNHPVAVRYPRGSGAGVLPLPGLEPLPYGKGEVVRQGKALAILAFGPLLHVAQNLADDLNATLVNMRWAKPLDQALIASIAKTHSHVVTLEEGSVIGGVGAMVGKALHDLGSDASVLHLGLPDVFVEHGDPAKLMALQGLDASGIAQAIAQRWPQFSAQGPLSQSA
jgi:1-deoxy-D-xylulose-5-phosphate synthase